MTVKIISGGQTGADIGGLVAAEALGLPTGGFAPRGWKTEKGPQPILGSRFGLVESEASGYPTRTRQNIEAADLTLVFARLPLKGGSRMTMKMADQLDKVCYAIDPWAPGAVQKVYYALASHQPQVVNIAGRRESVMPGIAKKVSCVLRQALTALAQHEQHMVHQAVDGQ